jgi:hypothetical protein
MSTIRSLLVIPTQLIAGIAAAGLVSAMYPGPMAVDTVLGGGTSIAQGLFIEVFLTAQLVFVILMLAVEKQRSTYLAPLGIGIAFFLTELSGNPIPSHPLLTSPEKKYLPVHRRLLHRRFHEPRTLPRPRNYKPLFPRLFLDLLGRSWSWVAASLCLL